MRNVLIPLSGRYDPDDPEDLDMPALQAGIEAARRLDAHVQVLCVTAEPSKPEEGWTSFLPAYALSEQIERVKRESAARARRTRAAYEEVRSSFEPAPPELTSPAPGFSVSYVEQVGDIRETIGAYGRLSDLIVIASSKTRWEMPFRPILEASLRRTACPVFVSPFMPYPSFATSIAIAWNDSVESSRAVSQSLPLLTVAQNVVVISCKEGSAAPTDPTKLTSYLAWHGISAKAVEINETGQRVEPAIVEAAQSEECDLLVLGAYVHTRAYSLLFGSLTQFVLSDPKIPALLVP